MAKNEGGTHHLHGGNYGEAFSHKFWTSEVVPNGVKFTLYSPDGDCNYPGTVHVTTTYTLAGKHDNQSSSADLKIVMEATLEGEKSSPIGLTNHSYFNLAGHNSKEGINDQEIMLNAKYYTAYDEGCIPTRSLQSVEAEGQEHMNLTSGLSFAEIVRLQMKQKGYTEEQIEKEINGDGLGPEVHNYLGIDHNYVIQKDETQQSDCVKFGKVSHQKSGRALETSTTAPGVQLYTANWCNGDLVGKGGALYARRQGFCLETQTYPDAINIDESNQAHEGYNKGRCFILRPGGPAYRHEAVYSFTTNFD